MSVTTNFEFQPRFSLHGGLLRRPEIMEEPVQT